MKQGIVLRFPRSLWGRAFSRSIGVVVAAVFAWFGFSKAQASNVYVLLGGNATSDATVIDALTAGGHVVTAGVQTSVWDGTQANLNDYDVVVVLDNFNYISMIPVAGRTALVDYVSGGGGIVTSEWLNYLTSCNVFYPEFAGLMPVLCRGYDYARSTTYSQVQPDSIIDDGLPSSFDVNLRDLTGTESILIAKEGAMVFFDSSNGGVPGVGVAGWDVPGGRVISFSTLVTDTELASAEYQQLLSNAAKWARNADLTVTNSASPDPVPSGQPVTYTIAASSDGPSTALAVTLTDQLSEQTTFESLAAPPDWSCDTPPVGQSGTVTCTKPSVGPGEQGAFVLVANVNAGLPEGTRIDNTAAIAGSTFDPNADNNSSTATVTVSGP
jgi:uncharacterized repeat protein (TIGR01451 family)